MPAPVDRSRTHASHDIAQTRDAVRTALVNAALVLLVALGAWLGAPYLERQDFWADDFGGAHLRTAIPLVGSLFLIGALAPAVFPQAWEGELLSRGLRALGWTAALGWLVGHALEAPEAAALFVAPALLSMPFSALGLVRRAPDTGHLPVVGVVVTTLGLLGVLSALIWVPARWPFWSVVIPSALAYAAGAPLLIRRARRDRAAEARGTFDLPPGVLHPPAGTLGVFVAIIAVAFAVFLVAPGVPLSAPVAWTAFALGIPAAARSLVRRHGIAHPRALVGRPDMTIHHAAVHHLPDVTLERLDRAVALYLRYGIGRRRLARTLALLLEPTLPHATAGHLAELLGRLPPGPWLRRRREQGLARLLGGERILAEAEAQRR